MTKKRVRAPSTSFGQWQIRYVQVPYDNRYFDIYKYGDHILRLPASAFRQGFTPHMFLVGRGTIPILALQAQLAAFKERVEAYDKHLDSDPGAGDTTFALKA